MKAATLLIFLFLSAGSAERLGAQGCSQCREAAGQTPAETQRAYRKAIVTLVVAASAVFGAGLYVTRRFR